MGIEGLGHRQIRSAVAATRRAKHSVVAIRKGLPPITLPQWIGKALKAPAVIDTFLILAALALTILVLAILGAFGLNFGLDVSPLGEDYVWIDLLRKGKGAGTANLWWVYNYRNPLSPWWYIAVKPIILNFDSGLFAIHYGIIGVLAVSTYCMVLNVAGLSARVFALALGILIIFWMANRYPEQIVWNFQGALCASLLSIAAYARFIEDKRKSYLLLTSVALYFLAIATYTLQCGAVLAIGYLTLRRAWRSESTRGTAVSVKGIALATSASAPYLALLVLFLLIWRTTMDSGAFGTFFSLQFSLLGLLTSLREGLWNEDLALFFARVSGSSDGAIMVMAAAACGIAAMIAVRLRSRREEEGRLIIDGATLGDVAMVLACLAAPTIALESSSQNWTPGERWPMIYQLTTPAVLLALGAAALLFMRRSGLAIKWAWPAFVGLAVGVGELLSLGHNQTQIELTRNENYIRESVTRLVAEDLQLGRKPPEQVLLMLDNTARSRWRSFDILSPIIARVWLQRDDISFRLINWFPISSYALANNSWGWGAWWRVRFGPDSDGVSNSKVSGGTLPYDHVRLLQIKDGRARRVLIANQSDFAGFEVDWDRDGPITFAGAHPRLLCPLTWTADQDALANGWNEPERDARGGFFRSMVGASARLTFAAACPDHSTLRVTLAPVPGHGLDGLVLRANGGNLQYRRHIGDEGVILEAELPNGSLSARPIIDLQFTAPRALTAIKEVEILPPDRH